MWKDYDLYGTARDARSITGRGFQIVLSRSFVGEVSTFISALEVGNKNERKTRLQAPNEGEDFPHETSRQ